MLQGLHEGSLEAPQPGGRLTGGSQGPFECHGRYIEDFECRLILLTKVFLDVRVEHGSGGGPVLEMVDRCSPARLFVGSPGLIDQAREFDSRRRARSSLSRPAAYQGWASRRDSAG